MCKKKINKRQKKRGPYGKNASQFMYKKNFAFSDKMQKKFHECDYEKLRHQ